MLKRHLHLAQHDGFNRPALICLQQVRAFATFGVVVSALTIAGCRSSTPQAKPAALTTVGTTNAPAYPSQPSVAPPAFKVFHHDDSSITLVTDGHASDAQIEALIWQLHDAAQSHSFAKIGIPQTLVDKRNPIVWFHIYRGPKCADEKYTNGPLPCGASYHAAGDYTLGSFHNPNRDDGVLLNGEDHQTELWNPDAATH